MTGIVFRYNEPDSERTRKLNQLAQGKVLASTNSTFTLTSNLSLTTVSDPLFTASCVPLALPLTSNASTKAYYIAARTNGEITLGHASNNVSNATYAYAVIA